MRRAAEDSEGANDDTLDGLLGLPGIDTDFVGLEGLNKKPTKVSTPQPPKIPDLIKLPEFPNVYADTNSGTQVGKIKLSKLGDIVHSRSKILTILIGLVN